MLFTNENPSLMVPTVAEATKVWEVTPAFVDMSSPLLDIWLFDSVNTAAEEQSDIVEPAVPIYVAPD